MKRTEEQKIRHREYMREWCRQKRGTKPGANPGRPANTADVLWSKVDKREPNECWPWLGVREKSGYGRTWIDDVGYYAHRVIFDLANPNQITLKAPTNRKAKGFLMHTCDNRICCNPAHLKVADIAENNKDCRDKGRRQMPKGENHHRSVFTDQEIAKVLQMKSEGQSANQIAQAMQKKPATIKSLLYRHKRAV